MLKLVLPRRSHRLNEAMQTLRQFVDLYPAPERPPLPRNVEKTSSLLEPVTATTVYKAMQYSPLPSPRLTFRHLELLHHRLVSTEKRRKDVEFVTWVAHTYAASGKPRTPASVSKPSWESRVREAESIRGPTYIEHSKTLQLTASTAVTPTAHYA